MADFEMWSVFWFLCVMCVASVEIHCQLVKVFGICVTSWKQEDTMHGFQQWQDRPGHQACPLQMMHGIQTCSAADIARELDIHWVTKNPTDENRGHCMGLSVPFLFLLDMLHWSKRAVFGAETWLITQNLKLGKGWLIQKLSSPSSKENGSIISKDDHGKLSGDHKHVLVLYFIDHGDTACWLLLWYT